MTTTIIRHTRLWQEKARCDALLERERELERRRAKEDAGDLGQAGIRVSPKETFGVNLINFPTSKKMLTR